MRKKEHLSCGCAACKRGAATTYGKYVHKAVNKKVRRVTKVALRNAGEDFEPVLVATPYTD